MSTTHLSSSKSSGVDVDMPDGQEDLLKVGAVIAGPPERGREKRAVPNSPRSADEKRSLPPPSPGATPSQCSSSRCAESPTRPSKSA